jgi:hypothetical protein
MFGSSDSADRRKAWWRAAVDRLLAVTGALPRPARRPDTDPIHRDQIESRPIGSARELQDQQHVNAAHEDEVRTAGNSPR